MGSVNLVVIVESLQSIITHTGGDDTNSFHIPSLVAVGVALGIKFALFLYCMSLRKVSSQVEVLWEDHRNDIFVNGFGQHGIPCLRICLAYCLVNRATHVCRRKQTAVVCVSMLLVIINSLTPSLQSLTLWVLSSYVKVPNVHNCQPIASLDRCRRYFGLGTHNIYTIRAARGQVGVTRIHAVACVQGDDVQQ